MWPQTRGLTPSPEPGPVDDAAGRPVKAHSQLRHVPPPPLDQVDPTIGTGSLGWSIGQNNPGAQYPFGALRLGPDTAREQYSLDFTNFGGYIYQYVAPVQRAGKRAGAGAGGDTIGWVCADARGRARPAGTPTLPRSRTPTWSALVRRGRAT